MKTTRRKLYLRTAAALFVLWVALSASAFAVMLQPVETLCRVMSWTPGIVMGLIPFETLWSIARGGDLRPGDRAPDFELPREDGAGRVTLREFHGKRPVALIFGSYT